jgi:hypothetical protein
VLHDVGIDARYGVTAGLNLDLTYNTDFAEAEADDQQVNLTRFSLFFPERRDFFLDGATFFDFRSDGPRGFSFGGGGNQDDQLIPFFSRRIGLSAAGTPQKIDFGTKVTGQMGAQDVGLFHVRTGEDDGMIGEDFTVARVKRRVLRQSYIGALYTRRDARVAGADTSETLGLDARLATSTFLGSQNLQGSFWFLRAMRPGVTARNNAYGTFISYPNDRWDASLAIREIQSGFDPTVGFVEMAVRELGAERVVYGSDAGGRSFASQLAKVQGADSPAEAKRLILAGNLRRLLLPSLQAKGVRL